MAEKHAPQPEKGTIEVSIERLGAQGDGIARAGNKTLYIPLALPGEVVRARVGRQIGDYYNGELVEIIKPSPTRAAAACPHFSRCGGCSLQHLNPAEYVAHKKQTVETALRQHRLGDIDIYDPIILPAGSRRRITLAALYDKQNNRTILGFNARASHQVIDLQACPVTRPELVFWLPALRLLLLPWLKSAKALDLTLTLTESGIDLLITGPEPDLAAREVLGAFAKLPRLARVSWRLNTRADAEPLLIITEPVVTFGGVRVVLPAGAFTQASRESEAIMSQWLTIAIKGQARRVADLFSGVGTFSFPLAREAEVHAFESDGPAMAALTAASRQQPRVRGEARDLFRDPLSPRELEAYDAVVFDPPRAGAQAQAAEMARSRVPLIMAVSCNTGTFARDAATLIAGGYTCNWIQPIDQFLWSSHVELVAKFTR